MPRDKVLDENFSALDSLIRKLANERDKRKALDTGILLANEVLRILGTPAGSLFEGEDALDRVIPASAFPNQKAETWFEKHPYMGGERTALRIFTEKAAVYDANFYALNSSATKARISAGVMLNIPNPNWEDSDLTEKPAYKVGIDFFLPPKASSLLMVISRRGKLRVMELSERLTNTQHDIFKQIENVFASGEQSAIHQTLWSALELRELNNKFYEGIAKHFEALAAHLQSKKKPPEDSKQFTARLLGRILFVWFLRKKNMVNADFAYFDADDIDAGEYYTSRLEPLFFSTLNTPSQKRTQKIDGHIDRVTPYLNGGLFYDKPNDWLKRDGNIPFPPDWFRSLYDHLERFNFTTDESSPQYEQVAIDPEMLGRVFESLLATQFTETGEQIRKSTGAFYTPREIVDYMCRESLRQYLYAALGSEALNSGVDKLLDGSDSAFVTAHTNARRDLWGLPDSDAIVKRVIAALQSVAILDPACGSGAFPMGILQLLLKTYERLDGELKIFTDKRGAAEKDTLESRRRAAKLAIIQNNLYGVDIEEMAVEIARLRAWLSIVVDEENVRNVQPLPNLDFKFVRGNSLLSVDKQDLWNDAALRQLEKLKVQFFSESDGGIKFGYTTQINQILRSLSVDGSFDFKIWFSEVFKEQAPLTKPALFEDKSELPLTKEVRKGGGFDIVIANPPYRQLQANRGELASLYQNEGYVSFVRSGDIYQLFYERGLSLLRSGGFLCFITSNKWMRAGYGEKTRNFFAINTKPITLIDFAGQKVFETATVDVNIIILQKNKVKDAQTHACVVRDDCKGNLTDYFRNHASKIHFAGDSSWIILNSIEQNIKSKIESSGVPLKDWDISINYGIKTGCNEAFIISKEKRDELIAKDAKSAEIIRPILRGRDIGRYKANFADLYLINTHNGIPAKKILPVDIKKYPAVKKHLDQYWDKIKSREDQGVTPYNLRSCAYMDDFSKPKIMYSEIVQEPQFYLDKTGEFYPEATTFIMTGSHLEYLLRILHSKLFAFSFKNFYAGGGLGESGYRYKKAFLEQLPILVPNQEIERDILKISISNIDNFIYQLYNLTKKDIEFIENQ